MTAGYLLLGATIAGLASALLLHELGHACAARLLGGRIERLQWRGLGARVIADLPHRRAQAVFLLAGAGANLVVAGTACALAFGAQSPTMALAMGLLAGMHVLHAVFTLVPAGETDGARLLALTRARHQDSQGER